MCHGAPFWGGALGFCVLRYDANVKTLSEVLFLLHA